MKKKLKSKPSKKSHKLLKKKRPASKKVHKKTAKKKGVMKKLMTRLKKHVKKMKPKKKLKKLKKMKKSPKKAVKKKTVKKLKPLKKLKKKVSKKKVAPKKAVKVKETKPMEVRTAPVSTDLVPDPIVTVPAAASMPFSHEPVLMQEVLLNLELADKNIVVDGTLGLGGHSKSILEKMPAAGKVVGFDVDEDNMAQARQNLLSFGDRALFVRSNFGNLQAELAKLNIKSVDAILLDLGLSSPQVDNPEKGFSFLREGPLDMRFDKTQTLTAAIVINTYGQNELIRIFQQYGEEPFARKIATEIARRRKSRSFKTTTELANFIEKLIGRKGHLHPATRVFQALRIEVNHELDVLQSALKQSVEVLRKGGRLAVIAYHSLEDHVVKHFFKDCARDFINEPDKLTTTHLKPTLRIITKKPIVPTEAEISQNPRSRSAKLRVAEKI